MKRPGEFSHPVQAVRTHMRCQMPECSGEMVSTGMGMGNNFGTKWLHRCSACNVPAEFDRTYPTVEFIDVEACD